MVKKSISVRNKSMVQMFLFIGVLIMANLLAQPWFFRWDLTKEKRFTLSKPSKVLAGKVKQKLFFKVYLEGDFPAGFQRLKKATRDLLEEYRSFGSGQIQYEFVDPFSGMAQKEIADRVTELQKKGLQPTQVQVNEEDELSQKIIVPAATLVGAGGKEIPVNLMREQFGAPPEEVLNQSIENLEYVLSDAIRKAEQVTRPRLAFIKGHGELTGLYVSSIVNALSESYEVEQVALLDSANYRAYDFLQRYACVIVAKPLFPFLDFEKFKLDQYIMNGGKIIWLTENLYADLDSISAVGEYLTPSLQTGLDEMLFSYGVRVNHQLLSDQQCNLLRINQIMPNGQPKPTLKPWTFHPVFTDHIKHPIVNNLEPVLGQFVSTLDTVAKKGVQKTVLLKSSSYSRAVGPAATISFGNGFFRQQDLALFNRGGIPTAVLLEGNFVSYFRNFVRDTFSSAPLKFKDKCENNKMIVIGDGDLIRNPVKRGSPFPLGFDPDSRVNFGNQKFFLNCVDYLVDGSGLIEVRNKEFQIRLLDRAQIKQFKLRWQVINLILPIILLFSFAWINQKIRKSRYTRS